jgi:predicted ATP-grasp superfamily ATP-dependent carboligase
MVIDKPRYFPVTGGTGTCNMTISRPDIVGTVRTLLEGIGWVGLAEVDMIIDERDNTAKVLEINPRASSGIKISFKAGVDFADMQIRLALGEEIPVIKDYKLGIVLRNLCMDILWYIHSSKMKRKNTRPPFWKFFGKDVYYQTFCVEDPLPLFGFILNNVIKYLKPGRWAAKSGKEIDSN